MRIDNPAKPVMYSYTASPFNDLDIPLNLILKAATQDRPILMCVTRILLAEIGICSDEMLFEGVVANASGPG